MTLATGAVSREPHADVEGRFTVGRAEPRTRDKGRRVFVLPATFDCVNVGDVAMLQTAVARIRDAWPYASFSILTRDADALRHQCPGIDPVYFDTWFSDRFLLGAVHRLLPTAWSRQLVSVKHAMRSRLPQLEDAAITARMQLNKDDRDRFRAFLTALGTADLYMVAGASGPNDTFRGFSRDYFALLQRALGARRPCVIMGSGLGPISDASMLRFAKSLLPRVAFVALREKLIGQPLLASLGVDANRVAVTGDDAVEMSYSQRSPTLGTALGVNIRTKPPANFGPNELSLLASVIKEFVLKLGVDVVPLPIRKDVDAGAIRDVAGDLLSYPADQSSPSAVIRSTAQCRVVITGAYHAAVFALSQGVPTVCVSNSRYFSEKFLGLQDLFGPACEIVSLGETGARERLRGCLEVGWANADDLRSPLLASAVSQILAGRSAYRRVCSLVEAGAELT